jgi:Domain of unknown function (DUF4259)
MGAWGNLPWDNDGAADWFGDLFDRTKLAKHIEDALKLDVDESHEEIRAAAAVLLLFGHVYVWPLAANRLEQIAQMEIYTEAPEILACIRDEIQELRSRIKEPGSATPPSKPPNRKWWQFWQ